jgi:hypothetical protein
MISAAGPTHNLTEVAMSSYYKQKQKGQSVRSRGPTPDFEKGFDEQHAFEGEKGDEKLRCLPSVLVQEIPEGAGCQEQHRG